MWRWALKGETLLVRIRCACGYVARFVTRVWPCSRIADFSIPLCNHRDSNTLVAQERKVGEHHVGGVHCVAKSCQRQRPAAPVEAHHGNERMARHECDRCRSQTLEATLNARVKAGTNGHLG